MTVLSEVREAVSALARLTDETRTILKALSDGRVYLKKNHPEASGDLAELLEQMRATVVGLHSASRIVMDFDFTIDGSDRDRQPARFNAHLMRFTKRTEALTGDISLLKGSCTRVRELSESLQARAEDKPWWALLGDRAGRQAGTLSATMAELYGLDSNMADEASRVLRASEAALQEVRGALRVGDDASAISVSNIEAAAVVLHDQAVELGPQVDRLRELRDDLSEQIAAFDRPKGRRKRK